VENKKLPALKDRKATFGQPVKSHTRSLAIHHFAVSIFYAFFPCKVIVFLTLTMKKKLSHVLLFELLCCFCNASSFHYVMGKTSIIFLACTCFSFDFSFQLTLFMRNKREEIHAPLN